MIVQKYIKHRGSIIKVSDLSDSSCCKVDVICPICKNIRSTHYRSLVQAGHHHCLKCVNKIIRSKPLVSGKIYGMLTVLYPSNKVGYSVCECECGTVKECNNSSLRTGHTKSCGCLRSTNFKNTEKVSRDRHGMWKGGVTEERECAMQRADYKTWRSQVFKRDNFTCQKCGQIGYELNAHHINNYSENEDTRVDVNNGITLCLSCHVRFHTIYGKKTNKQQMDTYLLNNNSSSLQIQNPMRCNHGS